MRRSNSPGGGRFAVRGHARTCAKATGTPLAPPVGRDGQMSRALGGPSMGARRRRLCVLLGDPSSWAPSRIRRRCESNTVYNDANFDSGLALEANFALVMLRPGKGEEALRVERGAGSEPGGQPGGARRQVRPAHRGGCKGVGCPTSSTKCGGLNYRSNNVRSAASAEDVEEEK